MAIAYAFAVCFLFVFSIMLFVDCKFPNKYNRKGNGRWRSKHDYEQGDFRTTSTPDINFLTPTPDFESYHETGCSCDNVNQRIHRVCSTWTPNYMTATVPTTTTTTVPTTTSRTTTTPTTRSRTTTAKHVETVYAHAWTSILGAGIGGLALGVILTALFCYCRNRSDIKQNFPKAENIELHSGVQQKESKSTSVNQESYYYALDAEEGFKHVYENDP